MLWVLAIAAVIAAGALMGRRRQPRAEAKQLAPFASVNLNVRSVRPTRKRKTDAEFEQAMARYIGELRTKASAAFQRDRASAQYVGSKFYTWRISGDSDVCDVCKANNGKKYRWTAKVAHGHPGECTACPAGYCRCYAEAVIPD